MLWMVWLDVQCCKSQHDGSLFWVGSSVKPVYKMILFITVETNETRELSPVPQCSWKHVSDTGVLSFRLMKFSISGKLFSEFCPLYAVDPLRTASLAGAIFQFGLVDST